MASLDAQGLCALLACSRPLGAEFFRACGIQPWIPHTWTSPIKGTRVTRLGDPVTSNNSNACKVADELHSAFKPPTPHIYTSDHISSPSTVFLCDGSYSSNPEPCSPTNASPALRKKSYKSREMRSENLSPTLSHLRYYAVCRCGRIRDERGPFGALSCLSAANSIRASRA